MAEDRQASRALIDRVKMLDVEYRLNLTEQEAESIARQAESYERLFRSLHEIALYRVVPLLRLDLKA